MAKPLRYVQCDWVRSGKYAPILIKLTLAGGDCDDFEVSLDAISAQTLIDDLTKQLRMACEPPRGGTVAGEVLPTSHLPRWLE
jgi:hypothetical protein